MKLFPLTATAALILATSLPASAQLAPKSKSPIDVTADQLEVVNAKCQATWSGNAEALQDTARLRAQVLRVFSKVGANKPGSSTPDCGTTERMEAEGEVYYQTPQQRIRANSGVYLATSDTLTMTGDVVAVQGKNVLRGERMVINTSTGEGKMQGVTTGRNKPGRVRGVIYPNEPTPSANK